MDEELHDFVEAVITLQNWLEDNLPDDIWESVPVDLWNEVTIRAIKIRGEL